MTCRICAANTEEVLDLGETPPANWLKSSADEPQASYPLVLEWCEACGNVQLRDTLLPEDLYRDYLYVTPRSTMLEAHYDSLIAWLEANGYVRPTSSVVEPGSNAGLFLDRIRPRVASVLGVDPAEHIVAMAQEAGIPTICEYFNLEVAEGILHQEGAADLVVARHCLAHNPSPHEMLDGAEGLLADDGFLVIENAYALNTIENTEFDQIYHEHMFYFSIRSMKSLLAMHGMRLVDVFMSVVHGGSIVFVAQKGTTGPIKGTVGAFEPREAHYLNEVAFAEFAHRSEQIRDRLVVLVDELHGTGQSIYTYGATAKGNTLLNYAGITSQQIPACVDSTPMKQGRFLPKSGIEIISEEVAAADPPDYYLLTAWNYQDEIISKVRREGNLASRFIIPIPFVRIL